MSSHCVNLYIKIFFITFWKTETHLTRTSRSVNPVFKCLGLWTFRGNQRFYLIQHLKRFITVRFGKWLFRFDGGSLRCRDRAHYSIWFYWRLAQFRHWDPNDSFAIVNTIYLQCLFVKALNFYHPLSNNAIEMNKKVW